MNREQKIAAVAEIAAEIESADAIFAVDYRGITVPQAAELRAKLRDADTRFRVVKNSLTERAAEAAGAEQLVPLLVGPTALAFVRGDSALAAKAIADYARVTQLLPFKGGMLGTEALAAEQIAAISRLPGREVLYGQLVGVVASPVSGLVRTLAALTGGLAVALGQLREKKEAGEVPSGEAPAAETAAEPAVPAADQAPAAGAEPVEAEAAPAGAAAAEAGRGEAAEAESEAAGAAEAAAEDSTDQAEPAPGEPAQDDNEADASASEQAAADANKED